MAEIQLVNPLVHFYSWSESGLSPTLPFHESLLILELAFSLFHPPLVASSSGTSSPSGMSLVRSGIVTSIFTEGSRVVRREGSSGGVTWRTAMLGDCDSKIYVH